MVLHCIYRKDDFREGQWETIARILQGKDTVVPLPTGADKTIAFQLAAFLLPGRCAVVDPILSLIDDQLDNLNRVGIDRCAGISSQIRSQEERQGILSAFARGEYLFTYIAPERFQTVPFRDALRTLTETIPISLVAVDEAHCVSEWGHDFRTAYLNLGRVAREFCRSHDRVAPLVALTGTASKVVLQDVQRELEIGLDDPGAIITPRSFDRPSLQFYVIPCRSDEKEARLQTFLSQLPSRFATHPHDFFRPRGESTAAGLVFCPHVNGRFGVVQYAERLRAMLGIPVEFYSGASPRSVAALNWEEQKKATAHRFKQDKTTLLACTKAFGMGIDKPNIRYTVHIGLPDSIESFYQEAGRAGRDGGTAHCAILVSNDYLQRSRWLLSPDTPIEQIVEVVDSQEVRRSADDVTRALWFHASSFRGVDAEMSYIEYVVDELGQIDTAGTRTLVWVERPEEEAAGASSRNHIEKALHRLVIIGVVADYTIEYSHRQFTVTLSGANREQIIDAFARYAAAYLPSKGRQARRAAQSIRTVDHREFVLAVAKLLVEFIYENVELARRSALREMLLAAEESRNGEEFRRRILKYFETSNFDDILLPIVASQAGGLDALPNALASLVSSDAAEDMRGAVARLLGSYPDLPGLLLLRGAAEALIVDGDDDAVRQFVSGAINVARSKYEIDSSALGAACGQVAAHVARHRGRAHTVVHACLASGRVNRAFVLQLIRPLPPDVAGPAAAWLVRRLEREVEALVS